MANLNRSASIVIASATLAAAFGISAAPAFAAARTWTIRPGGAIAGRAHAATLRDTTTGASLTCTSSTLKGKLASGRRRSGHDAGTVTAFRLSGCSIEGTVAKIAPAHLPWHLSLVSYKSAKGVTTATLTGIHLALSDPTAHCSAKVDGTAANAHDGKITVTYANKTGKLTTLTTHGNLHLYDASTACEGVIANGNAMAISTTYKVSRKQTITGP